MPTSLPTDTGRTTAATSRRFFVASAALALVLDQATKIAVQATLMGGTDGPWRSVRILGDLLRVSPTRNPDGLFGMTYGPPFIYYILPILGMGLVVWFALRNRDRWSSLAYGMIMGGALGNLIDRFRVGWVIDFIDFRVRHLNFHWFTFNLADAFIVVGIVLLLAREIFGPKPVPAGAAGVDPGLQQAETNDVPGESKEPNAGKTGTHDEQTNIP